MREILKVLENHISLTREERNDIKLIFNELIYNAIIHGNRLSEEKKVHVNVSVGEGFVSAGITDEGCGFNTTALTDSPVPDTMHEETGRGIRLATALADKLTYSCNGRQVFFLKKVGKA
jgi:serine/threonine-protein kinase RsbW